MRPGALFSHGDQFVDGISFCGEFFLVFSHDISRQIFTVMQIVSIIIKNPAGFFYFFKRKVNRLIRKCCAQPDEDIPLSKPEEPAGQLKNPVSN